MMPGYADGPYFPLLLDLLQSRYHELEAVTRIAVRYFVDIEDIDVIRS